MILSTILSTVAVTAVLLIGRSASGEPSRQAAAPVRQVVFYCFFRHGDDADRQSMESVVEEALREDFADELGDGRLVYRAVDLQEPGSRALAAQYAATEPALVLAELLDGEAVRHKRLDKLAGLADDEASLARYVQYETRSYLRGQLAAFLLLISMAIGLGMFTAVQPCPMATNIAAISFLARQVGSTRGVLLGGLLYALGRTLAYVALAVLLVGGMSHFEITSFLHKYLGQLIGPVLILVAMFLLGLIRLRFPGLGVGQKMQKRVESWGVWAALPLGMLFALSFCPVSAGCFFLSLFALLAASDSWILLPSLYGVGTALPVVGFAVVIAFSTKSLGKAFNAVTKFEFWFRRIAAVVFLLMGIYLSLEFCFGIPIREYIMSWFGDSPGVAAGAKRLMWPLV